MEEFPLEHGDWDATISQCVCTCGKAVVYTGVTVILPIITWLVFVADSLVLSMEDRQTVTPAPTINPIMMRTMESSISEKP